MLVIGSKLFLKNTENWAVVSSSLFSLLMYVTHWSCYIEKNNYMLQATAKFFPLFLSIVSHNPAALAREANTLYSSDRLVRIYILRKPRIKHLRILQTFTAWNFLRSYSSLTLKDMRILTGGQVSPLDEALKENIYYFSQGSQRFFSGSSCLNQEIASFESFFHEYLPQVLLVD